jgi:LAS superfamily LD-carboxypeptidase LdcB
MLRGMTSGTHTPLDALQLTGRARTHLVELDEPRCTLHVSVVAPFLAMRAAASLEGLQLEPASSFRDFERQRLIWNAKYRGERPLLDRMGRALDAAALTPAERVDAILAWSALPGASRHHWGTDLDVYDRAALPEGARPELVPAEFAPGGPSARLDVWLAAHAHEYGFYRPYMSDRGGGGVEPWHKTKAPRAQRCAARLDADVLREALGSAAIDGAHEVRGRLDELLLRYVAAVDAPPQAALQA